MPFSWMCASLQNVPAVLQLHAPWRRHTCSVATCLRKHVPQLRLLKTGVESSQQRVPPLSHLDCHDAIVQSVCRTPRCHLNSVEACLQRLHACTARRASCLSDAAAVAGRAEGVIIQTPVRRGHATTIAQEFSPSTLWCMRTTIHAFQWLCKHMALANEYVHACMVSILVHAEHMPSGHCTPSRCCRRRHWQMPSRRTPTCANISIRPGG